MNWAAAAPSPSRQTAVHSGLCARTRCPVAGGASPCVRRPCRCALCTHCRPLPRTAFARRSRPRRAGVWTSGAATTAAGRTFGAMRLLGKRAWSACTCRQHARAVQRLVRQWNAHSHTVIDVCPAAGTRRGLTSSGPAAGSRQSRCKSTARAAVGSTRCRGHCSGTLSERFQIAPRPGLAAAGVLPCSGCRQETVPASAHSACTHANRCPCRPQMHLHVADIMANQNGQANGLKAWLDGLPRDKDWAFATCTGEAQGRSCAGAPPQMRALLRWPQTWETCGTFHLAVAAPAGFKSLQCLPKPINFVPAGWPTQLPKGIAAAK